MHKLAILDPTGHTELAWHPANTSETERARATFESLVGERGFAAFDLTTAPATPLTEFRPQADEILLVPQFAGG